MSTISVPLPPHLEEFIQKMIKKGYGTNKADVMRKALTLLAEEEAVFAVLKAMEEPTIKGNLRELVKKL